VSDDLPGADVLSEADRLYGLPLGDFTAARDARARELKASDKDLAAQVKKLRKPSLAAWVVNLLVRREPEQVDQMLSVGAALRDAAASLDGAQLRELTRQRRQLTAAVTVTARGHAREHGQKVTPSVADEVESTLTAAMVDAGAAAAVRSGLLVKALASTGVEALDLSAYVAVPDLAGFEPTSIGAPEPDRGSPPDLHVVPDPDAGAKKLAAARERLAEAEEAVESAREGLAEAEEEVAGLEARSLQLQAEIDELRRRLAELEEEQDEVDESLAEAEETVSAHRSEVSAADATRQRAADVVARLERA
jgi:hypothetical protein